MIYTKIPQMADTIMEVFKEASFSFSIYLSYILGEYRGHGIQQGIHTGHGCSK